MPISIVTRDGTVEDVTCHKQRDKHYLVKLGDMAIGELYGSYQDSWGVVSHAQGINLQGLRLVRGFRTKWNAIDYLLAVGNHYPEDETLEWARPDYKSVIRQLLSYHVPEHGHWFLRGECGREITTMEQVALDIVNRDRPA